MSFDRRRAWESVVGGHTENGTSLLGNMYTYTAREWDAETGMLYYRSRYLDPEMGRFIQRDSIGIWGDPVGLGNGYAYVGNRAIDGVDPSGNSYTAPQGCGGGGGATGCPGGPAYRTPNEEYYTPHGKRENRISIRRPSATPYQEEVRHELGEEGRYFMDIVECAIGGAVIGRAEKIAGRVLGVVGVLTIAIIYGASCKDAAKAKLCYENDDHFHCGGRYGPEPEVDKPDTSGTNCLRPPDSRACISPEDKAPFPALAGRG
jgi:RHS repeat-associated protein